MTEVKKRAGDKGECCDNASGFIGKNNEPYLEVHHMGYNELKTISRTRSDHVSQIAAICPNCHANIHHGIGGDVINEELFQKIKEKCKKTAAEMKIKEEQWLC